MTTLDWILLAIVALSLVIGVWRGLVFEVLSVLGWVASFFAAQYLAPQVADRLPVDSFGEPVRYAAAFVLTFVVAVFAAGLLASLLRKLVSAAGLRPVDRMLGAAFGLVRGLVLLLVLTVVVEMTALKTAPWWQQALAAPWLSATLAGLKPVLPQSFARYLP